MSFPEAPRELSETDWAIRVGVLQEADSRGVEHWPHKAAGREYLCMLTAEKDRYETTALVATDDDIVPLIDHSGFSPDGFPINPGPWMIQVVEMYRETDTAMAPPDRFHYFRGKVRAKAIKFFTLDEHNQTTATFYMVRGKIQPSIGDEDDTVQLIAVLDSLDTYLREEL